MHIITHVVDTKLNYPDTFTWYQTYWWWWFPNSL